MLPQVQFDRLREAGQVVHAEHGAGPAAAPSGSHVGPHVGQHRRVGAAEIGELAERESRVLLADLDHPPGPVQQRGGGVDLRLDVDGLESVDRVHDGRQVQPGRVAPGEAGVAVGGPLHRRADAVPVAEPDVVAHADLVAVVQARRAGQAQQHRGEQLLAVAVVVQQRRQPAADADVRLHPWIAGVLVPHVVAVLVADHLQGQLVVVAQEDAPLRRGRDGRRLGQDLRDREA